jgi:hypothetical protein
MVREFFNNLASALTHPSVSPRALNTARWANEWKEHARAAIDDTLDVTVLYERWANDGPNRVYRGSLCESMGVPITDRGADDIHPAGGGSSFKGDDPPFPRWKALPKDLLDELSQDEELMTLNRKLFGSLAWKP